MFRVAAATLAALLATVLLNAADPDLDAAFARFWSAKDPAAAAKTVAEIIKTGVPFDDVHERLKRGRAYSKAVATGIVQSRRMGPGGEFVYTVDVPPGYDPSRKYQVRFQLHGGTMRDQAVPRRPGGIGRLAGVEQIYILPTSWSEAPWWNERQVENLRGILDAVKRTYNIDENRVAIAGVSDGGTGAYYIAMRDPTPYCAFLPLNGHIVVLSNREIGAGDDLFPGNLRNRPLFVVNGGRDPLYPLSAVEPYIDHFRKGGVAIEFRPQPNAGHDTTWWPNVKDAFEAFVREHPRAPLPDRLTWETADIRTSGRVHWLIIDSLGDVAGEPKSLPDLNDLAPRPVMELGVRMEGTRVDRVMPGTNAAQVGLKPGDVIQQIGDTVIDTPADMVVVLQRLPIGSPVRYSVLRAGKPLELSGTFAPTEFKAAPSPIFPHHTRSGRVDLERSGNRVTVDTRGVRELTLLLSSDQFDFSKSVQVITNGRTAFEGHVEKSVATLLKWAARDNDRTMLYGAELKIRVR